MGETLHGTSVDLMPVTLLAATALLAGDRSHLPLSAGYPHADTADALSGLLAAGEAESDGTWFVVRRADGLVVGDLGWRAGPDADGVVEIGYGLAEPARGLGLGTDAVRTLMAWMLRQPGVDRVRAEVLADNLPSRRLLERLGFAVERIDPPNVIYLSPAAS